LVRLYALFLATLPLSLDMQRNLQNEIKSVNFEIYIVAEKSEDRCD